MQYTTYTIAVLGQHDPIRHSMHEFEFARVVGSHTSRLGALIAHDAQGGFGSWVALGALELGAVTLGFSPASSQHEHQFHYRLPLEHTSTMIYTGFGYLGRDVVMVRSCDCVLVFLGTGNISHITRLARELQKPLLVVCFEKTEEEIAALLGDVRDYAEIFSSQEEVLARIEKLISLTK